MLKCATNMTNRPTVAVTTGDPAGIGPEIVCKALQNKNLKDINVVVVGQVRSGKNDTCDAPLMQAKLCKNNDWCIPNGQGNTDGGKVSDAGAKAASDKIPIGQVSAAGGQVSAAGAKAASDNITAGQIRATGEKAASDKIPIGQISAAGGQIAYENIAHAVDLALTGKVDAIATAPINKESLKAAGIPYIGHTEILAALTHTKNPLTMFETGNLRVFFLSRHLSMRDMLDQVTKDNIIACAKQSFQALSQLGIESGTMAVAGLNPHCGEHGLFGSEEQDEIIPAIEHLQNEGYNIAGPIEADSIFHLASEGMFNSVLSLYHDQGHIATKTLDFHKTISVTCGMPFVRTSVDHGTAFDIAGKGIASEVSMVEAILLAAKYSKKSV